MHGQNSSKITTIIANYNYEDYVIDSITSALNQTYKNHEIVCVDDGSSDNSFALISKNFPANSSCTKLIAGAPTTIFSYKNLRYLKIKNSGASIARNVAISLARGSDAIMVLDSDDVMYNNKVEKMAQKLFEYDEVGVVYADYLRVLPLYSKIEHKEPYSFGGLVNNCIVHSGSLIKMKYLERVALKNGDIYDPNLHGPASKGYCGSSEDYCLWLRLSKVCMMVHIPEILTLVNEHGKNQSLKMTPELFAYNFKIIENNLNQKSL